MNSQNTSAGTTRDLQLEIAHLLLIDVVGYSKLLVNEQIELLQELKQIVRSTECFGAAEARGELIRVPTGDGMALVFFHSPGEPVRCALEISKALQDHPNIRLRMGVHSGPINRVTDVNEKTNIAGPGNQCCAASAGLRRCRAYSSVCARGGGPVPIPALATVFA